MWKIEIKQISEVRPIDGADAIECAIIGDGWPCVVRKGDFKVGDRVVYYPEDSVMPQATLERMGLVGRLAGSDKNRVKAIRLRGQMSIGLVEKVRGIIPDDKMGLEDLSEFLGITRYEAPVPECLRGKVIGHPPFWHKYDIGNINDGNQFNQYDYVWASEKIHGTAVSFCFNPVVGFFVSSRNLTLERDENNLYWKMALKYDIEDILRATHKESGFDDNCAVTLHGEIAGKGVQDLTYSLESPELFVYGLRFYSRKWMPPPDLFKWCRKFNLLIVPPLFEGMFNRDQLNALANEPHSTIDGRTMREGIVVRNYDDTKVAKIVSDQYKLRRGGTEFH